MSSFVLSLVSPVLRSAICGNFRESICKSISLDDVKDSLFMKVIRLTCGDRITVDGIEGLVNLAALADRLQMEGVKMHAEHLLLTAMNERTWVKLFKGSEAMGLECLRAACYKMLRDKFHVVSREENFGLLSEETMGYLLDEDDLGADREQDVFEAVVKWLKCQEEGHRGGPLMGKIRFGAISVEYRANSMLMALPDAENLKNLVRESMVKSGGIAADGEWDGVERLSENWMASRSIKNRVIGSDVLVKPRYITVDSQGQFVISDSKLHQVIVLKRDGYVALRMGSHGKAAGQVDRPAGVAVDQHGRIIVADENNNRVQVFNADGSVVHCFGTAGSEDGQLKLPLGVAIDREGNIVVVDFGNHRIQVFSGQCDGTVVRRFGSRGTAIGQLLCPTGVAVDGLGRIVVADSNNTRVQVFNGDGSIALCFGSRGDGPGHFFYVCAVAVDTAGQFVVVDYVSGRIQVFGLDGGVVRIVDAAESSVGPLNYPTGVTVDGSGFFVIFEGCPGCLPGVRCLQ